MAEIHDWYEEKQIGLGEEFLESPDAAMGRIQHNPLLYEVIQKYFRRVLLRRFPYLMLYEYSDNLVMVYGIFHTSRDLKKWRNRLP